jgi:hypothetical protein
MYRHYKDQLLKAIMEIISVYSENLKKTIHTLCDQNVELFICSLFNNMFQ